jgi:hypothetical protein
MKKAIQLDQLEPGDKLRHFYGKGLKANRTIEFRGLIDGHFAVLRRWHGFAGWYYWGEIYFDIYLRVNRDVLTLVKRKNDGDRK